MTWMPHLKGPNVTGDSADCEATNASPSASGNGIKFLWGNVFLLGLLMGAVATPALPADSLDSALAWWDFTDQNDNNPDPVNSFLSDLWDINGSEPRLDLSGEPINAPNFNGWGIASEYQIWTYFQSVGHTELAEFTDNLTFMCRVKYAGFNDINDAFGLYDGLCGTNPEIYTIEFFDGEPVFLLRGAGASSPTTLALGQTLNTNTWYDITAVFDAAAKQMRLFVYSPVTGQLVASANRSVTFSAFSQMSPSAQSELEMFLVPCTAHGLTPGAFMELAAVWDQALTQSAIAGLSSTTGVFVSESHGDTIVQEGETSDSYTVIIGDEPTASVMITATPADDQLDLGAGAGGPVMLTFTTANWNVAQMITVNAVDDAVVESVLNTTITHSADSPDLTYDGIDIDDVVVSVADNDQIGDLTGDGLINMADLIIWAAWWLSDCFEDLCEGADLTGVGGLTGIPGFVDQADFSLLHGFWLEEPAVIISEFMASNGDTLETLINGIAETPDWIEFFNPSILPANLDGWYLTDDQNNLTQWAFPNIAVAPGEFLVIFASGFGGIDDLGSHHTNFQLAKSGDFLALVRPDGTTVQEQFAPTYPRQVSDVSFGRLDGVDRYFSAATPGGPNSDFYLGLVSDSKFSPDRGFYTNPIQVVVTSETSGAYFYYTTDGSAPTLTNLAAMLYSGPIHISNTTTLRVAAFKPGWRETNVDTHTYIFLDDVIDQPQMDPDIVDDPLYSGSLKDDMQQIPTLSMVMDYEDLFGSSGIYTNPNGRGEAWERAASLEMFFADKTTAFQVNCGMRMFGVASRGIAKKAFRAIFKGKYGPTFLEHDFLPIGQVDRFNTLIIRSGDDNWLWGYVGAKAQYVRDMWTRDTELDMGHQGPDGIFAHLYLNGEYWGLYTFFERPDAAFMAEHFGAPREDYDTYNGRVGSIQVIDGTIDAWNTALAMADAGLSTQQAYDDFQQWVDVTNLADYYLVNIYNGNTDWPGYNNNNWRAARHRVPDGKMVFFSWDSDTSLSDGWRGITSVNYDNIAEMGAGSNSPQRFFHELRQNPEFLLHFADRAQQHFFNDGVMTPQSSLARWIKRSNEVDRAMVAESARWGDAITSNPYTHEDWLNQQDFMQGQFFPQRTDITIAQLKFHGLYPTIDAPQLNQHGGQVAGGFNLTMSAPIGDAPFVWTTVLPEVAACSALVPADGSLGLTWFETDFLDGGWLQGNTGVGYDYAGLIGLDVGALMQNIHPTVYVRVPFSLHAGDLANVESLRLRMKYEDGFIAYLNGHKVAASNASASPQWDSFSTTQRNDAQAVTFQDFDITVHLDKLQLGDNILGIHALNVTLASSDLLALPELQVGRTLIGPDPDGGIYYTLDGSDPRLTGGAVSPQAVEYDSAISLTESTQVKARAFDGGQWSALTDAIFTVGPLHENLRISEIMYHPADAPVGDPLAEYIELQNVGAEPINVNLVRFTRGINFIFPDLELAPNGHVVVVRDLAAFVARYGLTAVIAGQFTGELDNGGERLILEDAIGRTIHDFAYKDGWFEITDGLGFSLTAIDPAQDPYPASQEGLVAHWKLDETGGASAADSAGTHTAALNGNPQWQPLTGRIDGALAFDGADDFVEATGYGGIVGGQSRTVAAWVKTLSAGNIVTWGQETTGEKWTFRIDDTGAIRVSVQDGFIIGFTNVRTGHWTHVAVVLHDDGDPDVSEIELYVNGVRESIRRTGDQAINTSGAGTVRLGAFTSDFFTGDMDDVRLYDRDLSAEEIAALAQSHDLWDDKDSWRASTFVEGSPGADDVGPSPGDVVINEVLAHSDLLLFDFIELHNATDSAIDIGGWFLSDSGADDASLMKYEIAAGTTIAAHDYVVFSEDQHFGNPGDPGAHLLYALSENGETVHLSSGQGGLLTGYRETEDFGASEADIAFGRYQKNTGTFNFVAMESNTPGGANSAPKVGPIVINEIMYHPATNGDAEFIELKNISDAPVTLFDFSIATAWKFTDGIDYTFPAGSPVTLAAGEMLVLVMDLAAFNAEGYPAVPVDVDILEWSDLTSLSNGGEKLELSLPGDVDNLAVRQYIRIDRVVYSDGAHPIDDDPWPTTPDGAGDSLQRIAEDAYGNDIINWTPASPTPGQ